MIFDDVYKWRDLKRYFLDVLLHELDKHFLPNEILLKRLRYP